MNDTTRDAGGEIANRMRVLAEEARRAARSSLSRPTGQKDQALREAAAPSPGAATRSCSRTGPTWRRRARPARQRPSSTASPSTRSGSTAIATALVEVAGLPDPVGEVTSTWRRPNGLTVKKVRIPLGVVLMVYEARPNVTVEAAALCVKSGNAAILRPGSDALRSRAGARRGVLATGFAAAGLPAAVGAGGPGARPRGDLRAARPRRAHRPRHPAGRPGPHPRRGGALPRAGA